MCSLVSCASSVKEKIKDLQDTSEHWCARSCPACPQCQKDNKKDLQNTSEHRCARSCLGYPHHVEGAEITMPTTQASTNVLAHVLGIRAMSKRWTNGHTRHKRAPVCSFVSYVSVWCRRGMQKTRASTLVLARALT